MNISAKTEYACIAVLELALRYDDREPVQIRRIADTHGIPSRFLVQILLQLKGAGIVTSTRGASGGYQLRQSPDSISLGDVMRVIEGDRDRLVSNAGQKTPVSDALMAHWKRISATVNEELSQLTFADLASQVGKSSEDMYYI